MNYQDIIKKLFTLDKAKDYGYLDSELLAAEKRLNITIPKPLRNYYLALGKNIAINDTHNRLVKPVDLDFTEDGHLVFYEENQAAAIWGIDKAHLQFNNPKIYRSYDNGKSWLVHSETIDDFLLSMAYLNAAFGSLVYAAITEATKDLSPLTVKVIEKNRKEQKNISNQFLRFFTNDYTDILVLTFDYNRTATGLFYATNYKDKYRDMMESLNIKWDYRSDRDE